MGLGGSGGPVKADFLCGRGWDGTEWFSDTAGAPPHIPSTCRLAYVLVSRGEAKERGSGGFVGLGGLRRVP